MPAAAVIRRVQTLSGFIGRKECVGGFLRFSLNISAQPRAGLDNWGTRGVQGQMELMV